jgi:hypothetical protein
MILDNRARNSYSFTIAITVPNCSLKLHSQGIRHTCTAISTTNGGACEFNFKPSKWHFHMPSLFDTSSNNFQGKTSIFLHSGIIFLLTKNSLATDKNGTDNQQQYQTHYHPNHQLN